MALSSSQRNWAAFGGAAAGTLALAAAYLGIAGTDDESLRFALRSSAHLSFLVLLLVFVARPLRQLSQTPWTGVLLRNRRLFGIAFAGVHTAHLCLILYRDRMVDDFHFSGSASLLGGISYAVIYLMFLTSFDSTTRALGPKNWRILHKVGLYWIFLSFLPTLIPESREQLAGPNGVLIALTAVAIAIRLTAFFARRAGR